MPSLPRGDVVETIANVEVPRRKDYDGKFVTLRPVMPMDDADELFECSHGSVECKKIWTYMSYGPFDSVHAMRAWIEDGAASNDPLFLTVCLRESGRRVGMVSFLNIASDMLRLELGHIWYSPESQRSNVNTEAVYLMLCEAFDRLKYRRVEWKCDSLNERSRLAALRIGFRFEGIFGQHMIIKGRNRDTAWYALLDSEWPMVKENMQKWLYQNPDGRMSLTALNRLQSSKVQSG